jgi:hypothetical protein
MRVAFKKRSAGRIEFGILYGSIALLVLCAARFLPILSIAPPCTFKGITGIPCPTCGSTRSAVFLSQGDVASALSMNPLTALGLTAAVLYFFYSVVTLIFDLPRISFLLRESEKQMVRVAAIMLLLLQWVYLISTR